MVVVVVVCVCVCITQVVCVLSLRATLQDRIAPPQSNTQWTSKMPDYRESGSKEWL